MIMGKRTYRKQALELSIPDCFEQDGHAEYHQCEQYSELHSVAVDFLGR